MSVFLDSELTETERTEDAFFHVIPVPLERTVSYGAGTEAGPAAIIEASNELERLCKGIEPCAKGIYTHAALDCDGPLPEVMERLAAKTEAMMTDPVYEGKSMQGMIDLARKGFFPKGSRVLYAHLGGAPALNGYSYYYKDG